MYAADYFRPDTVDALQQTVDATVADVNALKLTVYGNGVTPSLLVQIQSLGDSLIRVANTTHAGAVWRVAREKNEYYELYPPELNYEYTNVIDNKYQLGFTAENTGMNGFGGVVLVNARSRDPDNVGWYPSIPLNGIPASDTTTDGCILLINLGADVLLVSSDHKIGVLSNPAQYSAIQATNVDSPCVLIGKPACNAYLIRRVPRAGVTANHPNFPMYVVTPTMNPWAAVLS